MAGTPVPEETPKLGIKATVAGLIFVVSILAGFGVATAASYEDSTDHGDDHSEDHGDDHSEDHADDDHADDHGDDHSEDHDEDHADE